MSFEPLPDDHPLRVAMTAAWKYVDEYIDSYDMECDDGTYHPNEQERMLIRDAIAGLVDGDEFQRLVRAEITEREKLREAEGDCVECGCHLPNHWGSCSRDTPTVAEG
jgi:glycosyltransferase involved in cell wall biosynthesis